MTPERAKEIEQEAREYKCESLESNEPRDWIERAYIAGRTKGEEREHLLDSLLHEGAIKIISLQKELKAVRDETIDEIKSLITVHWYEIDSPMRSDERGRIRHKLDALKSTQTTKEPQGIKQGESPTSNPDESC